MVYGYDNSQREAMPAAVCFPQSHEEIEKIVNLCALHAIPLTARGLGSGTTGAAVPLNGGVVLSTEKLNRIVSIDPENRNVPRARNSE